MKFRDHAQLIWQGKIIIRYFIQSWEISWQNVRLRDSMWCYIKHRDGTGLSTLRSVSPLRMGCMHNSRFRVVEGKRRRRKKRKHFDHGKTTGVDFQLSWKRYLKAFESRIPLTRPSLERSRILLPYLVKIAKKREKKKKKDYSDNLKPSILHESIEVSSLREMKLHFVRLWNVVSFYPSFYSANIFEQASPRILKGKKKKKKISLLIYVIQWMKNLLTISLFANCIINYISTMQIQFFNLHNIVENEILAR